MKVLFVEDTQTTIDLYRAPLEQLGVELTVAMGRDSALFAMQRESFDLILLDLQIPIVDADRINAKLEHGLSLVDHAAKSCAGTPVIMHSAHGSLDMLKDVLRSADSRDVFGTGEQFMMLDFIDKTEMMKCIKSIESLKTEFAQIDQNVELITPDAQFDWDVARVLKIFARRRGGRRVEATRITIGRSRAHAYKMDVFDQFGTNIMRAFAKVGALDVLSEESERYDRDVTRLEPGSYAPRVDDEMFHAGRASGMFFRLADEFQLDLFGLLRSAPDLALKTIESLKSIEEPWKDGPIQTVPISQLREAQIPTSKLEEHAHDIPFDWKSTEQHCVPVRMCTQHSDLHGKNVLVNGNGVALLVDYGNVGSAPAALDPLVLELCLLFMPEGVEVSRGWPTLEQAANWHDLDLYIKDCPFPNYVRACRNWAFQTQPSPAGVFATAYAYVMRQIRFPDNDPRLVTTVAQSALAGLMHTASQG